jgi:rhamnosyl/mannosyltransferase
MVGTGPLEEELSEQIRNSNLQNRVHMLGWQHTDVLARLFNACDIFVLPSTLSTECFGLVQVEAMLCGKPVINTDLPTGVPWVSQHEHTGLTVPPSDADKLAQAINTLLADDEKRLRLGNNARARAFQHFTLQQHKKSTLEHYEELLGRTSRHHSPKVLAKHI